jgi:iron complex outermembrane recepter protein
MHSYRSFLYRAGRRLFAAAVGSALFVATSLAQTAGTGSITGTVSNTATGQNLEGAEVTVTPANVAVLTTRDGRFTVPNLAPGLYTVKVTYSGLDPKTIEATVAPGTFANYDVGLSSGIYQLDKFVVEGEREGNALAITTRRNAGNVKEVISADAFGTIADLNLGNFMLRLPGVSKEESEGEIIRIQVRGVDANLNAVSIDGTRAANGSTRDFNRGSEIDKVPTDFIETIELTKAATPEMDADSIGGNINLRTKSALDRKGRRITYQFGNTYNMDQKSFRPLASVSYSDVLIQDKLGVLVTASYNESHKPRDSSNVNYERTTDTNRPVYFSASSFGEDWLKHKRAGLGVRFDYRFNPTTKVYFNSMFSQYEDRLNRHRGTLGTPTAAQIRSVTQDVTETQNQTLTIDQNWRFRDINTQSYAIGGESTAFWGGKFDFTANFSPSKGTEERFVPTRATAGVGFRQDRSITHNSLLMTQISGPDIFDWRNSTMALETRDNMSTDKIWGAQVNFRKPLQTSIPLAIKTGARWREQSRKQDQDRAVYSYVGANRVSGPVGAANDDNLERFYDPAYNYRAFAYPVLQYMKLQDVRESLRTEPQFFLQNVDTTTRDTLRNDGGASETVTAAYVQAEARLGKLMVITGIRGEETEFTGRGWRQEITPAERARRTAFVGTVTPEETQRRALAEYFRTSGEGKYRDWFPSLHFKYNFTRGLVGRLSYSTGIGRPNFGQIIPTQSINNDNLTVTTNNPDLQPQYSRNYDAALEYYFEPAGLFSVGAFQKNLRNFIFRSQVGTLEPGNDIGEGYVGYRLTTDLNGGSAEIRGLEVSYSQQFSNLQAFGGRLRGFGAFANFTWLETEGNYGTPGAQRNGAQLPNFTPKSGNLGVSYHGHGATVRVKWNYTGERLQSFNNDPSQRTYNTVSKPVDVNLAYAVTKWLSVYADVINVFNTPTNHEYTYIRDRKTRSDLYTTVIKFGVSGSF